MPDSEEVEVGTPAAGNIPERGGFENTGITESQYNSMKTFFKNSFGEDAYDDYATRITDDMRAKGGIFEGLSVEQSMFSIKQMIAWSNDEHGKFAKEITNIVNYLKECDESISIENASDIKEVIDSVNENGTIDGVSGTSPVMVRYFTANDCGEAGTYTVENASNGHTTPSTDGFDRYYMRQDMKPMSKDPVFVNADAENIYIETKEDVTANVVKSNNLHNGSTVATGLPATELNKTSVKAQDIVVQTLNSRKR